MIMERRPVSILGTKQLFLDDGIVAEMQGVKRRLNQPVKYAGNPIMIPLYPWEGRVELYGTVTRHPRGDHFQMWYTGLGNMGITAMGAENTSKWSNIGFDPNQLLYSICYATSRDGIFWERPNLRIVEYEGSRDNNVVLPNAGPANVVRDQRDPDPDRRYKALFFESRDPDGTSNEGDGVSVAFSPDGLHWTKYAGNPVITRASDSHTLLGWDDLHGQYVAYCRPSVHEGNMVRRIGRSVSEDFVNWTDPEEVLEPDEQDPPGLQFYNMPVFKYEGLYIGQLLTYHTRREEPHIRFYGTIDAQLAMSRDGLAWERVGDRKPFFPNGLPGSDDAGEVYLANAPLIMENELWFYYSPCALEHGITGRSGPICLAKLRLDGFVSIDAGPEMGTLITRPFLCQGKSLRINAAARGGQVEVAVLDESGIQYEGFDKVDCAVFDGDSIHHKMTWRNASYASLNGEIIALKFYLRNSNLYSFYEE